MYRLLFTGIALFLAYRVGQQQAQLNAFDYYITRSYLDGAGEVVVEYLEIEQTGNVVFSPTQANATPFDFEKANAMKKVLRSYVPSMKLSIEIINPLIVV